MSPTEWLVLQAPAANPREPILEALADFPPRAKEHIAEFKKSHLGGTHCPTSPDCVILELALAAEGSLGRDYILGMIRTTTRLALDAAAEKKGLLAERLHDTVVALLYLFNDRTVDVFHEVATTPYAPYGSKRMEVINKHYGEQIE